MAKPDINTLNTCFQFKFFGFERSDRKLSKVHHVTVKASSEREARKAYSRDFVLFFSARIPAGV